MTSRRESLAARRGTHLAAALLAAMLAAGCAPTKVQTTQAYQGTQLPRPDRVLVYDYAVTPDQVKLDSGIGPRLMRTFQGGQPTAEQKAAGQKVADAISRNLVAEIQKLGLPAERIYASAPSSAENRLIIRGDILSIDQGNRTRRMIIGLGAGSSEVEAETQVLYDGQGTGERLVQSYTADAESSQKPGMALPVGAGAAAGRPPWAAPST